MNFERPEVLKEFGLKVQPEMITIDKAKKLPRPEITAKDVSLYNSIQNYFLLTMDQFFYSVWY